jgi:ribosomal protein S18 acetylase RimI-like enzyme
VRTTPHERLTDGAIALRPISRDDHAFLLEVYASTRDQELATVPWDAGQKAAFLRMQFDAQHQYYQEHYADASFDVVLVDGVPAGRLYVARWPREVRIVDIALLPAFRGLGVGTQLLRALQEEAAASDRTLSIHVERMNPALSLYDRLGFRVSEDKGVYYFMEWRASS